MAGLRWPGLFKAWADGRGQYDAAQHARTFYPCHRGKVGAREAGVCGSNAIFVIATLLLVIPVCAGILKWQGD